jgi:hypothetical protein
MKWARTFTVSVMTSCPDGSMIPWLSSKQAGSHGPGTSPWLSSRCRPSRAGQPRPFPLTGRLPWPRREPVLDPEEGGSGPAGRRFWTWRKVAPDPERWPFRTRSVGRSGLGGRPFFTRNEDELGRAAFPVLSSWNRFPQPGSRCPPWQVSRAAARSMPPQPNRPDPVLAQLMWPSVHVPDAPGTSFLGGRKAKNHSLFANILAFGLPPLKASGRSDSSCQSEILFKKVTVQLPCDRGRPLLHCRNKGCPRAKLPALTAPARRAGLPACCVQASRHSFQLRPGPLVSYKVPLY